MNNPSPTISSSTDLVLQLAGGDRNGQLLPVSTAKCLLSSLIADKAEAEKYRCAIFRGEKGVAFRSYSELVLVNGTKTSVQWLKEGDTIQLTPELDVVVKQLGTFEPNKGTKAPLPTERKDVNTIAMDSATETPEAAPVASNDDQHVDQRMDALSDKLTSLVDAASESGTVAATAGLTNQPAPTLEITPGEGPLSDEKIASASSEIQDYLDKALTSTGAVAPDAPADFATATTDSRRIEATVEFPVTPETTPAETTPAEATPAEASNASEDSSDSDAAKLRKEEVTNSLNRLLSETSQSPAGRVAQPSDITAKDQSSDATKSDSVLLPEPTQPTTLEADELLASAAQSPTATQPAATETVEAKPTVDAPKAQSLDFLKSLGIDAEGLGLSETPAQSSQTPAQSSQTPAQENTTPDFTQPSQEDSPSSVLPSADEIIASAAAMGSVVATDSVDTAEVVAEEETSEPVAEPKKAESVADVLARMQNVGSLDSFSMDGPTEETSPEPVASVETEAAAPKPQVSETIVADAAMETESGGGDEDGSVEDYMSKLLNRMRSGEGSDSSEEDSDVVKPAPKQEVAEKTAIVETAAPEQTQKKLTAEQFVPKQKAVRMESFDSLREIANNSNRLAIQDHLANQRKVSTQTKLQLALIGFGFGILFFLMSCVFSSQISISGIICGIAFVICGLGFGKLYRDEQKLDASIIQAQKAKAS